MRVTVSIRDVARQAGVSVATVSHVINGTRFVSDETREKVEAAIRELHYSPNILARSFKTGSRDTVGFLVPDIANGYFATLIEEVEDVLQTRGLRLIVSNTREDGERELDGLRVLSSGVVDGFILASTLDDYAQVAAVLPADFPVVLIDRALANAPVDVITTDNAGATHEGVSALIERGHTRIGFMASVRHLSTTAERVESYRRALRDHGLTIDDDLVRYLESMNDPVHPSAQSLIDLGCTAIVASNNVLTAKLLAGMHASPSPRPVEILGYRDPTQLNYPAPEGAWLEEPIGEMGRLAGEAILRRIADPRVEPERTVLRASFTASSSPSSRAE